MKFNNVQKKSEEEKYGVIGMVEREPPIRER